MDLILEFMLKNNIPLTRENYINLCFLGDPPEEPDAEILAGMPAIFQDFEDDQAFLESIHVQYIEETQ